MSDDHYQNWSSYIRLIEHTWNTTIHDMTVTPFETTHGLPACSTIDTLTEDDDYDYCASDTVDWKQGHRDHVDHNKDTKVNPHTTAKAANNRTRNMKGFQHILKQDEKKLNFKFFHIFHDKRSREGRQHVLHNVYYLCWYNGCVR